MSSTSENEQLRRKVVRSGTSLLARQVLVRAVSFAGNLVLARLLTPADFGIYAIVSFVLVFFQSIGDLALTAYLIRKSDDLTNDEMSTVFWVQIAMAAISATVLVGVAPTIVDHYQWETSLVWLVRVLAACLFFTAARSVPQVLLQRELRFDRIAVIEVSGSIAFQTIAITLAATLGSVWALVLALVARVIVEVSLTHAIVGWVPSFCWSSDCARKALAFSLPLMGSGLMSLAQNAISPVLLGTLGGAVTVGYVNMASAFSNIVLEPVRAVARLLLPLLAKFRGDEREALTVIESTRLGLLCAGLGGMVGSVLAALLVGYVLPDKWEPFVTVFACLVPAIVCEALVQQVAQLFKIRGKNGLQLSYATVLFVVQLVVTALSFPILKELSFAAGAVVGRSVAAMFLLVPLERAIAKPILATAAIVLFVSAFANGVLVFAVARGGSGCLRVAALVSACGVSLLVISHVSVLRRVLTLMRPSPNERPEGV